MTEYKYELYVAFGADGTIEAARCTDALQERWADTVGDELPQEVRRVEFIRRIPDVNPVVLQPAEVTVLV